MPMPPPSSRSMQWQLPRAAVAMQSHVGWPTHCGGKGKPALSAWHCPEMLYGKNEQYCVARSHVELPHAKVPLGMPVGDPPSAPAPPFEGSSVAPPEQPNRASAPRASH